MQEQRRMNQQLENKNEEIKNFNNYLRKLKSDSYENEDLLQRYNEINKKKQYYKQKCKNGNIYLKKIFNILTDEQKQKLEKDGIILTNNNINDNISESSKDY